MMATRKKVAKKKGKVGGARKGAGRKKVQIDMTQVENLARIGCTDEEIGLLVGCSTDTIGRRKKEDPDFAEKLERGRANMRASLRRRQYQGAMEGNSTMLVWLGKNMLGQKDRELTQWEQHGPSRITLQIDNLGDTDGE